MGGNPTIICQSDSFNSEVSISSIFPNDFIKNIRDRNVDISFVYNNII